MKNKLKVKVTLYVHTYHTMKTYGGAEVKSYQLVKVHADGGEACEL
jgi:hypothetical protein